MNGRRPVVLAALSAAALAVVPTTASLATAGSDVVVTQGGAVEGFVDGGVRTWAGVPYAAPPVGDLRWRDPRLLDGFGVSYELSPAELTLSSNMSTRWTSSRWCSTSRWR